MSVASTIKQWTGKTPKYWLDFIGQVVLKVAKKIRKGQFKGRITAEPQLWIPLLTQAVWEEVQKRIPRNVDMDGNITCSRIVSLILVLWTCRVVRAKAYDPRRMIIHRKRMMRKLVDYHKELMECVSDESQDGSYFPSQEWESPYHAKRKDSK